MQYGVAGVCGERLTADAYLDGLLWVKQAPATNAVPIPGEPTAGGYEVVPGWK